VHARTDANCRWGLICMPVKELVEFGSRLTGVPFAAPPFTQSWRPLPTAGKDLLRLHAIASRMAEFRPQPFVDAEAAHGLEQQLIHAVVECLSAGSGGVGTATARRHQDIMIRFERLLQAQPYREMRMTEICSALAVSDQLLRRLCAEHLGMAPVGYDRLRRMSLVRRILLRDNHYGTTVAEVARRYGFNDPGRLSSNYRAVFAETPFATLRRRSGRQSRRTGP
jgi:AraC-like DNA-binding protein